MTLKTFPQKIKQSTIPSHVVLFYVTIYSYVNKTAAVGQWARALGSQAEGWVFESQPRQT